MPEVDDELRLFGDEGGGYVSSDKPMPLEDSTFMPWMDPSTNG